MSGSSSATLFGSSPNDESWHAAIYVVRLVSRATGWCAMVSAGTCGRQGGSHSAVIMLPWRRLPTVWAGDMAFKRSTWIPELRWRCVAWGSVDAASGLVAPRLFGGATLSCSAPARHQQAPPWAHPPACSQVNGDCTWTPATIFLTTDHLHHLLVKNYMRRDSAEGKSGRWFCLPGALSAVGGGASRLGMAPAIQEAS